MQQKPRKPITRCDVCGERVHFADVMLKKQVDSLGWVSICGIAHKTCAATVGQPSPEAAS